MAALVGVVEVVIAGRDVGQEVPVLAVHFFTGLWIGDEPGQSFARLLHVGAAGRRSSVVPICHRVKGRGGRERLVFRRADNEEARPGLGDAIVRRVEDFGRQWYPASSISLISRS